MGLFDRHDKGHESAEFMDLVLDAEGLHTPSGLMPLGEIRRAEFPHTITHEGYGPDETSIPAVAGGAVVGGVLFGAVGAVAGGLAGSTVKEQGDERLKTEAVQLIFETDDIQFAMDIPREEEGHAITFAEADKKAVKHHER